ncbi:DUF6798 domain-containing protein [Rubrivirga marina]|uniref:DUF6798 domain-containing protein n=1 Tax=Rubrivirga marina TaxID=1196024 RepID=A0A271J2N3_9BACT|nr:DUF6798 domain-containing protein [Rubrivirga marina]PAP77766.1 hypothetical protein BSZ37_15585 [Rubrivirga marina]
MTDRLRRLGPPLFVVVGLAAAVYWRVGYAYGVGDHEELIPQLLRLLDPSLYPRDPFLVAEEQAFSVRFVWLWTLRAACLVVPPPVAVFGFSALAWAAVCGAAFRLVATLVPSRAAAALAVLAAIATIYWTPGSNALWSATYAPESIAWAPALWAVAVFFEDRWTLAAVLLGVTAWIQPLMGLQLGLMLGLVALWQMADGAPLGALRRAVAFGAVVFAVASPILVPTLLTQVGAEPVPDDGLSTFFVTAWLRQAHHYLWTAQPVGTLVRFAVLIAAGGVGLGVLLRGAGPAQESLEAGGVVGGPRPRHIRVAARTLAVIAALVAVYVAMTEGAESLTVAKMQFFRLTLVAKLILLAWAAGAAVAVLPAGGRVRAEALFNSAALGWSVSLGLLAITVFLVVLDVGRPGALWGPRAHREAAVYPAERWIAEHTPRDAVVLVPPTTTTFRVHARRAAAVNFKPTTFRDAAMHRWLARILTVAPTDLPARSGGLDAVVAWRASLDSAYAAHTPAEWSALAETFDADYALVDRSITPTPPAGAPAFATDRWAVYRLRR